MVNRKSQALRIWIQKVTQNALMKSPITLSDLFHPETFLNAFRQRAARKLKYAINDLQLVSSFESGKLGG